ncbi:hypothetical protein E2P81_ATG10166 [Venturia nashicola]|nr:hypothetical protein E2P81_ATG10166 [Venturia nashicola]
MLCSTADNARNSPLLLLPPEIRSRIWDYVFDVGVIHVTTWTTNGHAYELSICRRPKSYTETPPRVFADKRDDSAGPLSSDPSYLEDHELCLWTGSREPFDRAHYLSPLRTCRLIYHEAVLKPFSVNGFQYNTFNASGHRSNSGLHRMIDVMVPMQARAIKRLHIVSVDGSFLSPVVVRQLKGLEHLDIQIVPHGLIAYALDQFRTDAGVSSLSSLPLKTLHISFKVDAKLMQTPFFDTAALIAWSNGMEEKLLHKTTNDGTTSQ